jgi:hypothetical protein
MKTCELFNRNTGKPSGPDRFKPFACDIFAGIAGTGKDGKRAGGLMWAECYNIIPPKAKADCILEWNPPWLSAGCLLCVWLLYLSPVWFLFWSPLFWSALFLPWWFSAWVQDAKLTKNFLGNWRKAMKKAGEQEWSQQVAIKIMKTGPLPPQGGGVFMILLTTSRKPDGITQDPGFTVSLFHCSVSLLSASVCLSVALSLSLSLTRSLCSS